MIDRATISNPKTHYGNPKRATKHFIWQRITGGFNILFALFIVWFVVAMAGAQDAAARIGLIRSPLVALGLVLLFVNVTVHMRIGMQEVIEDYLDHGPRNNLAMAANNIFAVLVAAVAILAIAKLVFWG